MVTIENWEEYAILRADGELDAEGMAALETFLAAHPELAGEAQMFDSLRMVPDETVVFAGKESLLKPEPRVVRFDRRWVYSVAAGVALLLGAALLLRSGEDGSTESVARIAANVEMPARNVNARTTAQPATERTEAAHQSTEKPDAVARTAPSVQRTNTNEDAAHPSIQSSASRIAEETAPSTPSSIQPMLSAETRMMAVTTPQPPRAGVVVSPNAEPSFRSPNPNGSRNLINRLPIDAERFALVDDIRQTASDRIQSIRETREKIRNTDVTIALGNRELFTLHF